MQEEMSIYDLKLRAPWNLGTLNLKTHTKRQLMACDLCSRLNMA